MGSGRIRIRNFSKVGSGSEINSFGSTTLMMLELKTLCLNVSWECLWKGPTGSNVGVEGFFCGLGHNRVLQIFYYIPVHT